LARAEEQCLTRAHGRAHRLLANARPVVAHVALHHDLPVFIQSRHAEGTCDDAVAAGDAARLSRRLYDTVRCPLDCIGRAHLGARRLLAVHADDGNGLHGTLTFDVFKVNHRLATVSITLRARLHAGLTPN